MFERLKWLLPALTLILALGLMSVGSRHLGRGSALSAAALEVVGPVERFLVASAGAVEDFWLGYFYLVDLRRENEALRERLRQQGQQLTEHGELRAANERLTSLLSLRQAYPQVVMKAAHVLAWDPGPWFRSIVISVGSDDGVAVDQAVVHGQGAVGRVIEVTPNYARVLLATDFNSSIDAFVQRTRAVGIVGGQGARPMYMKYVRQDEDVRPGDLVVTSGLDGAFPRGLALGTVTRVNRQSADIFVAVEVSPAVAFDRLEEVLVVTNQGEPIDWLSLGPRLRPLVEDAEEAHRRLGLIEENRPPAAVSGESAR
ncbi:MAG: rod shape-determining protein MreC [Candidatus Adiutrix sp.]|jgi:rod shape-determining protein MreC|nr:rod shape-determining protein MreC [Candidatus Adiutrix sp.]